MTFGERWQKICALRQRKRNFALWLKQYIRNKREKWSYQYTFELKPKLIRFWGKCVRPYCLAKWWCFIILEKALAITTIIIFIYALLSLRINLSGLEIAKHAFILTAFGLAFTLVRNYRNKESGKSEKQLELAKSHLNHAVELLLDRNNDCGTWIYAANNFLDAGDIAKRLVMPEYMRAYKAEAAKARHKLSEILIIKDPVSGEEKPLPPQFFYGIKNWTEVSGPDQAARKGSLHCKSYSINLKNVPPLMSMHQLDAQSVMVVYDFLEFPQDYVDRLRSVKKWHITQSNFDSKDFVNLSSGARRYIRHSDVYFARSGKLFMRGENGKLFEIDAKDDDLSEIDHQNKMAGSASDSELIK